MSAVLGADRWRRLRPLLDQALDLEPRERPDFLARLPEDAAELRADLERLLAQHARDSDGALDRPAAEHVAEALPRTAIAEAGGPAPFLGRRIGPFALSRLIGSGGMGAVYEAQRVEGGFRQIVAIKLVNGIHPGLHERFAHERQILAELRHPNIAQLLDGGQTSDGMPYFALEHVEGRSLTEHCAAHNCDLDARLALLVEVAEALAYAHRRKVIHRDIKPNNILVSADGHVKLLDFGIAKLLDDPAQALTRQQVGPMTPEYAAPEQFSGAPLGIATDVYQFGVLAFRLLTGRSPYRLDAAEGQAFARAVSEEPPLSLQEALRGEHSNPAPGSGLSEPTTRRRSERQRRADLDRILRRCLAKRPEQRYPSMDGLIADLEAVRRDLAPPRRRWHWRRPPAALLAGLLVLLLASAALLWRFPPDTWLQGDPWREEPALHAMGLNRSLLYASREQTDQQVRQAMLAEARGDLPSALALLEVVHAVDKRTPVPALLLSYWGTSQTPRETQLQWRAALQERLAPIDDPTLDLLARYVVADVDGPTEDALRFAGAVLELHPEAWFMRLARAHLLSTRGLREAALAELQQIDPRRLGHRKLVDAIADRASFGDLAGARALVEQLVAPPQDAELTLLQARLAYTGGDLAEAAGLFEEAVRRSRVVARLDIEARGLLYVGVMRGSLGQYDIAVPALEEAQQRLLARGQLNYAFDACLVLAQVAALAGDQAAVSRELDAARALSARDAAAARSSLVGLYGARLQARMPVVAADDEPPVQRLLEAWARRLQDDRDGAVALAAEARRLGIEQTVYVEEYALLARELGLEPPRLLPLDPPFGPYSRFASRWVLGVPVAPPRVEAH